MEVGYATDHGMPHSKLMKWSNEDRAKLRAYLLEESTRCPMCGTQPYEWDVSQGGNRRAYTPVEHFCQGCYIKDSMSRDNESLPGTTIQLVPPSHEVIENQRKAYERAQQERLSEAENRRGGQRDLHRRSPG